MNEVTLRSELEPLPRQMLGLAVHRGYPVPWFVDYVDGVPEFRAADMRKWMRAIQEHLCWVCGGRLGVHFTFAIGPMCGATRTTSEPPCHLECAGWSARNCPFLSRPQMDRRELQGAVHQAGLPILRNPGVTLLWTTKSYSLFRSFAGNHGMLIRIGDPTAVEWWSQGRLATRAECERSISSGVPLLLETTAKEEHPELAENAVLDAVADLMKLLPIEDK